MTTIPFRVGCELSYTVSGPSAFIFNVSVVNNAFQRIVEEQFTTEPQLEVEESRSPIEEKRHHRFSSSAGPLRVLYSATVELSHHVQSPDNVPQTPPGALPADVVPYLYPSRYCESDKLVRLAQHEFGKLQPGFSRVTAICNWIHNNVEYLRGATNPRTSAYDTATERAGVCRDFAHLGIAFCRAVAIPARFVAGYAFNLMPPDFHAYFEAYLDGRWYIFDATRLAPQTSFIRIGTGRDAADTSFATFFGAVAFSGMKITMEPAGDHVPDYTADAISTS
jgi:transglutaminase-like putative cysteine protease